MDRREFLTRVVRAGAGLTMLGVVDACGTIDPIRRGVPIVRDPSGPPESPGPVLPGSPRRRDNPIVAENRRRGDPGWETALDGTGSLAWAFAGMASAASGDTLDLRIASPLPVDVAWYRLGWYDGRGGRLLRTDRRVRVGPASHPSVDPVTGRAEAGGGGTVSLAIDAAWTSGLYLAVVRPSAGPPAVAPFVVRSSAAAGATTVAPVLFVAATATWQAYNTWGGADLYDASSADSPEVAAGRRAVEVSYDRPYALRSGAGYLPRWELGFVRWQERNGRDVDYCADVDLELHPEVVNGRRLILFVGHHEYWSRPMRATIERAIAAGTNAAFLSANDMCWQVRFAPSPLGPARRMVCYKSAGLDPSAVSDPSVTTCRWREAPVNDPEALVIGQMYGHIVARAADWIVTGSSHWLYEGTGLRDGDALRNLVGQEYDTIVPALAKPGTTILARSPVTPLIRQAPSAVAAGWTPLDEALQTSTIYLASSGATVFAAGTFQWSWAIDSFGDRTYRGVTTPLDPRVERMTVNLLDRLGDG